MNRDANFPEHKPVIIKLKISNLETKSVIFCAMLKLHVQFPRACALAEIFNIFLPVHVCSSVESAFFQFDNVISPYSTSLAPPCPMAKSYAQTVHLA